VRGVAIRVGILLAVIGFGSVILHTWTAYQFTYLMWAEGAQPWLGLGLGGIGLLLVGAPRLRRGTPPPWYDSTPTVPFARPPTWPGRHR
jgi:hypothetical protein